MKSIQAVNERLEAKYEQLTDPDLCDELRERATYVPSMPVAALMREAADRLRVK